MAVAPFGFVSLRFHRRLRMSVDQFPIVPRGQAVFLGCKA